MLTQKKLVTALVALAFVVGGNTSALAEDEGTDSVEIELPAETEEESFLPEETEEEGTVGASNLAANSITSCSFDPVELTVNPGDSPSSNYISAGVDGLTTGLRTYSQFYINGDLIESGPDDTISSDVFTFDWAEELAGDTLVLEAYSITEGSQKGVLLCSITVNYSGAGGGGGGSSSQVEGIGLNVDTHEGALAANKQISITGHQQQAHTHYALVLECASGSVTIVDGTASGSGNYSGLYKLPAMAEGTCTLSLTSTGEEGATYRLAMQLVVDAELRLSHIGTPVGSVTAS